jgi:hypothetical protein
MKTIKNLFESNFNSKAKLENRSSKDSMDSLVVNVDSCKFNKNGLAIREDKQKRKSKRK